MLKALLACKVWGRAAAMMLLLAGSGIVAATSGDIVFERKDAGAQGYPVAVFPHWRHRIQYRCYVCHSDIFPMKKGASEPTMAQINQGESCGRCHDGRIAFATGFAHCGRCHPAPAAQAGP